MSSSKVTSTATRLAYRQSLADLGDLLRSARVPRGWTANRVFQLTGITPKRLGHYENGEVPLLYWHALLLAHPLRIRLTHMIATLSRPLVSLTEGEHRALITFARKLARPHWPAMQREFAFHRVPDLVEPEEDPPLVDATLADWPEFLPPALENSLDVEADALNLYADTFDAIVRAAGGPVLIESPSSDRSLPVAVAADDLLDRFTPQLQQAHTRLSWIQQRHLVLTPGDFVPRVVAQRNALQRAIALIAPDGSNTAMPEASRADGQSTGPSAKIVAVGEAARYIRQVTRELADLATQARKID